MNFSSFSAGDSEVLSTPFSCCHPECTTAVQPWAAHMQCMFCSVKLHLLVSHKAICTSGPLGAWSHFPSDLSSLTLPAQGQGCLAHPPPPKPMTAPAWASAKTFYNQNVCLAHSFPLHFILLCHLLPEAFPDLSTSIQCSLPWFSWRHHLSSCLLHPSYVFPALSRRESGSIVPLDPLCPIRRSSK